MLTEDQFDMFDEDVIERLESFRRLLEEDMVREAILWEKMDNHRYLLNLFSFNAPEKLKIKAYNLRFSQIDDNSAFVTVSR